MAYLPYFTLKIYLTKIAENVVRCGSFSGWCGDGKCSAQTFHPRTPSTSIDGPRSRPSQEQGRVLVSCIFFLHKLQQEPTSKSNIRGYWVIYNAGLQ